MEHVEPKALYEYLNLGCEMIYILGMVSKLKRTPDSR